MIGARRNSDRDGTSQSSLLGPDLAGSATQRTQQPAHMVTLELTDGDRYAILVNALQAYASDALDIAQRGDSTAAERDHFQAVAATATELLDELG